MALVTCMEYIVFDSSIKGNYWVIEGVELFEDWYGL